MKANAADEEVNKIRVAVVAVQICGADSGRSHRGITCLREYSEIEHEGP